MSDESDLYLAFSYNRDGTNFNPIELAKLEPL